jgi:hypothetical protein
VLCSLMISPSGSWRLDGSNCSSPEQRLEAADAKAMPDALRKHEIRSVAHGTPN